MYRFAEQWRHFLSGHQAHMIDWPERQHRSFEPVQPVQNAYNNHQAIFLSILFLFLMQTTCDQLPFYFLIEPVSSIKEYSNLATFCVSCRNVEREWSIISPSIICKSISKRRSAS